MQYGTSHFGTWKSPLGVREIADEVRLRDVQWDGGGQSLVWLEEDSGRPSLFCLDLASPAPRRLNSLKVKAGVGYGGGDFSLRGSRVYFAAEGRLWCQNLREEAPPRPLTPAWGQVTAPAASHDQRWVAYVHSHEDVDVLAAVDGGGSQWPFKLSQGRDFYLAPTWHPQERRLAWVAWDHPNMPWDGSGLYSARVVRDESRIRLEEEELLRGDPCGNIAISQPLFSPDGSRLCFLSDESGWTLPWTLQLDSGACRPLLEEEADFGPPSWIHGMRSMAFSRDGHRLYLVRSQDACCTLQCLDLRSGGLETVSSVTDSAISQIGCGADDRLVWIGSSPQRPPRIATRQDDRVSTRRHSRPLSLPVEGLSRPRTLRIEAPHPDPRVPDWTQALYYPPAHPDGSGDPSSQQEAPPAIIHFHGGPTSQSSAEFDAEVHFYTSRGFAYVELNYRGSSGFGRAYADALKGRWGELELEDVAALADHLEKENLAHPRRMAVSGGSAGGYSALLALALHPGRFRAAVCRYPVTDLFALAAETHKFERHYTDSLVGRLPEDALLYQQRSPVLLADQIQDPVAIFQGRDDQVVPPGQAQSMASTLEKRGVPCLLQLYPDEGHGFKENETLQDYYQQSLKFLRRHLIFNAP
ncbi:MAG TPA: prolyl oligopeptidase family serine peptidase [Acidobacteriota bacterium]|nr:prolyl oligopeptidase family serine peptidase [Acidobacteriota bacterium]